MTKCAHHFAFAPPDGSPTVEGKCRYCSATKTVSTWGEPISDERKAELRCEDEVRRREERKQAMTTPTPAPPSTEGKAWREMTKAEHKAYIAAHEDELRRALGDGPGHLTNARIVATYTIPQGSIGELRKRLGIAARRPGHRPSSGKNAVRRGTRPAAARPSPPSAEGRTETAPIDALTVEFDAMRRVANIFDPLPLAERARILEWARAKYGVT